MAAGAVGQHPAGMRKEVVTEDVEMQDAEDAEDQHMPTQQQWKPQRDSHMSAYRRVPEILFRVIVPALEGF